VSKVSAHVTHRTAFAATVEKKLGQQSNRSWDSSGPRVRAASRRLTEPASGAREYARPTRAGHGELGVLAVVRRHA
jgi:hypothetical protein